MTDKFVARGDVMNYVAGGTITSGQVVVTGHTLGVALKGGGSGCLNRSGLGLALHHQCVACGAVVNHRPVRNGESMEVWNFHAEHITSSRAFDPQDAQGGCGLPGSPTKVFSRTNESTS